MIINTNIEALKTTNILNESHNLLARSLARLSSGGKIVKPSDDAAGLAVSSRLKGQMSRVDSSRIATWKARELASAAVKNGSPRTTDFVAASDAFFPFADGILTAIEAGARAVIQPGGSVRDEEVIKAADAHNVAMVFTGVRHFRH